MSTFISAISATRFCSMLMRDFDQPLALLRGLILRVLAQIAELARALDLLRQLELQLVIERWISSSNFLISRSFIGLHASAARPRQ